jgi:hypothetical protein
MWVNACEPGDITVTPIHTGFMLGRALPEIGPGPWWQYIAIYRTLGDAIYEAKALAKAVHAQAWLHADIDSYQPISMTD